jgi:hypothetical protein
MSIGLRHIHPRLQAGHVPDTVGSPTTLLAASDTRAGSFMFAPKISVEAQAIRMDEPTVSFVPALNYYAFLNYFSSDVKTCRNRVVLNTQHDRFSRFFEAGSVNVNVDSLFHAECYSSDDSVGYVSELVFSLVLMDMSTQVDALRRTKKVQRS